jgi:hypothetical protein
MFDTWIYTKYLSVKFEYATLQYGKRSNLWLFKLTLDDECIVAAYQIRDRFNELELESQPRVYVKLQDPKLFLYITQSKIRG